MIRSIYVIVVALGFVIGPRPAWGQNLCTDSNGWTSYFGDGLSASRGYPCSYSISSQNGDAGCWADGLCNNGSHLDVSFYQEWTCVSGHVQAWGNNSVQATSGLCPLTGEWELYNYGLQASGTAYVFLLDNTAVQFYAGWDALDCEGGYSYSGPYSYWC